MIAHEFGHVLGLGHCLDCDSAMNYSWQTIGRVIVTGTDVEAVIRRFSLVAAANDLSKLVVESDPRCWDPSGGTTINLLARNGSQNAVATR